MFDKTYTENYYNDLIEATYEIAPSVFYKYTWNPRWGITLDDYIQEAAIEIHKLFEKRFITEPRENYTMTNLKTYVYSILDKYFTINLINTAKRKVDDKTVSVDALATEDYSATHVFNKLTDDSVTPDDYYTYEEGKKLLQEIAETFSVTKIRGYKHSYNKLSDYQLAKSIVEGKSQNEVIQEILNTNEINSQSIFIRQRYRKVYDALINKIKLLDTSLQEIVIKYLETK